MRRLLAGRIHKRPFVVTSAVLIVFLLAGILLVFFLGFFRKTSETSVLRMRKESAGTETRKIGLNISSLPTSNFIWGASFEDLSVDRHFTVFDGGGDFVYLLQDPDDGAICADGSFVGGSVCVLSLDEQGKMTSKLQSNVIDFAESQFAPAVCIGEIEDETLDFTSLFTSGEDVFAFSSDGRYIRDVTSGTRKEMSIPIRAPVTSVSEFEKRIYVLCDDWNVFFSTDGNNYSLIEPDDLIKEKPRAVISVGRVVVACGDNGSIYAYSGDEFIKASLQTDSDLLSAAGNEDTILLVGTDGTMIASSNGILFRSLSEEEKPFYGKEVDWKHAIFINDLFYVIGSKGEYAEGRYDSRRGRFYFEENLTSAFDGTDIDPRSLIVDSEENIVLLSESAKAYVLSEDKRTWKELSTGSDATIDAIGRMPDGKIILFQDRTFCTTRILSRVQYDEGAADAPIRAGDICFLSSRYSVFDGQQQESFDGHWQIFGAHTNAQIAQEAPITGGNSCLKMSALNSEGKPEEASFVSQIFTNDGSKMFQEKTFYRVEIWLRQEGMTSGEAMVWISGNFDSVGTVFTDIGNNWRHYSALFVLPKEACSDKSGEMRLNIGFWGEGELYIDKVFLGADKHSSESIPEEYLNVLRDIHPGYIRLSNIPFGSANISSDMYYFSIGNEVGARSERGSADPAGCASLEASLRTTRYVQANPWFVMDASLSRESIDALFAYLCGNMSDYYGKMRIDNGTAVPWSAQFERLIIEITDIDHVFRTDLQKGAYVDYVIENIKKSPYYIDVKDKILFLDGMTYTNGSMLSSADYHSSILQIDMTEIESETSTQDEILAYISNEYIDLYDQIPRILTGSQDKKGEWVSSANIGFFDHTDTNRSVEQPLLKMNAAIFTEFLLHDYGRKISVLCVDVPDGWIVHRAQNMMPAKTVGIGWTNDQNVFENADVFFSVLASVNESVNGVPQKIEIIPPIISRTQDESDKKDLDDSFAAPVVYAFIKDDSWVLVALNDEEDTIQFRIEFDFRVKEMFVFHFSESGVQIGSPIKKRPNSVFTLLPGQYIIVKGKERSE